MYNDKQIERYFNLAKNASDFSDYPKIHIGAVLIYKNKILSIGYNTTQSHPIQKEYNQYRHTKERTYDIESMPNSLHAEMSCLVSTKHLDIDWDKASIFVYRCRKNGKVALAKPCSACSMALCNRGIKNIYYTTNNGWNYERREY